MPKFSFKKVVFGFVLVFSTVVLLELILQICSFVSFKASILLSKQKSQASLLIKDEKLGVRGNPAYPGHDAKGFHNKKLPQVGKIDVIALGDSQTYGYGVDSDKSWPSQLGQFMRWKVYNMAIESSGPVQSLLLFDEALELKPQSILTAIYLGNDLYDSYEAVYTKKLAPAFCSRDARLLKAIADKEKVKPLMDQIARQGAIAYQDERDQDSHAKNFICEHSRLWGLFETVQRLFFRNKTEDWQAIQNEVIKTPGSRHIFDNGKLRTVFTPNYRLIAVDTDDPRIQEGLRIALEAISSMAMKAREARVQFWIVLIPTKEAVFKRVANHAFGAVSAAYQKQTGKEEIIRQKIKAVLQNYPITVIDLLSQMQESTERGIALYAMTWDGHPNATGYRTMAEIIAKHYP